MMDISQTLISTDLRALRISVPLCHAITTAADALDIVKLIVNLTLVLTAVSLDVGIYVFVIRLYDRTVWLLYSLLYLSQLPPCIL